LTSNPGPSRSRREAWKYRGTEREPGPQKEKGERHDQGKGHSDQRRAFFGTAGVGAASVALGTGSARPALAQETGDERTRARYQKTEHVETFYRTNRYYPRGTN
jgi:hypothetical protein